MARSNATDNPCWPEINIVKEELVIKHKFYQLGSNFKKLHAKRGHEIKENQMAEKQKKMKNSHG